MSLTNAFGERERVLGRLYTVVLDQVAGTVTEMLASTRVRNSFEQATTVRHARWRCGDAGWIRRSSDGPAHPARHRGQDTLRSCRI